jgi:hypothetical protein
MKSLLLITLTIMFLFACKSTESIDPQTGIIGKWTPSYITQIRNPDGSWGEWHQINTLIALPVYEFTSDGRFLRDGKPGAALCISGNRYKVTGDKITFTERDPGENRFDCVACENWTVYTLTETLLILEECGRVRNKFVKQK